VVLFLVAARSPLQAALGVGIVASGAPVYFLVFRRPSPYNLQDLMTWIRTIPLPEADEKLRRAIDAQKLFYPKSTRAPCIQRRRHLRDRRVTQPHPRRAVSRVRDFGVLMAPDLPLTRRQHEMITTVVSVTNRCRY